MTTGKVFAWGPASVARIRRAGTPVVPDDVKERELPAFAKATAGPPLAAALSSRGDGGNILQTVVSSFHRTLGARTKEYMDKPHG